MVNASQETPGLVKFVADGLHPWPDVHGDVCSTVIKIIGLSYLLIFLFALGPVSIMNAAGKMTAAKMIAATKKPVL